MTARYIVVAQEEDAALASVQTSHRAADPEDRHLQASPSADLLS